MATTRLCPGLAVAFAALLAACGSDSKKAEPLTIQVGATFPAGTILRDHYSGRTVTVGSDGSVVLDPDPSGVVLLERDGAEPTPFRWDASTVYFAVTDRFHNGDPANDASYGRTRDGADEVGTWHGGDLAGLTAKLDHLADLGATAVWISPIVEQVHGWVPGGGGRFKHHAYAGYWALDFTKLDASFGTEDELRTFVDEAHARGLRVVLDVVLNHPGYATGADLVQYLPGVFFDGTGADFRAYDAAPQANLDTWNQLVNYDHPAWSQWWSTSWVRADLGVDYSTCSGSGCTDLTQQLAFLPDFRTNATAPAALPPLLAAKEDTGARTIDGAAVADYLVAWHADWVRRFGFDGFRCDTAKHVERTLWKKVEEAATAALEAWRLENPGKSPGAEPFWMLGEVFPHGVVKDDYFTLGGFDALLNFDLQSFVAARLTGGAALVDSAAELEALYAGMATALVAEDADRSFDVVSYLSSHDTSLFFELVQNDPVRQRAAGTALLLVPGSAQIFYGDESGRRFGPTGGDILQGTRSDMNWTTMDQPILDHWRKLGTFRKRHAAVGAGTHARLDAPAGTYAFSRTLADGDLDDRVVVVLTAPR